MRKLNDFSNCHLIWTIQIVLVWTLILYIGNILFRIAVIFLFSMLFYLFHLVFLFIKLWLDMARFLTNAIFLNANPIRKRCLFDCDVYFNLILRGRCLFEASLMLEKILLFSLLLSTIRFTLDWERSIYFIKSFIDVSSKH